MNTRRVVCSLIVLAVVGGCRRQIAGLAPDPMLESLRSEQRALGFGYAEGQGKHLFDRYCSTCHGDGGKGDGQNASNLSPPPPDLTTSKNLADPAYVRRVIADGSAAVGRSPLSPPWGRSLSTQEIGYLTLYCRALAARGSPVTQPR